MSDSVRPHRWQPTRLPCPWDSPGKNTGELQFWLKTTQLYCLTILEISSPAWVLRARIELLIGLRSFWRSEGRISFLVFIRSGEASCILWLMGSSSVFRVHHLILCSSNPFSFCLCPSCLSFIRTLLITLSPRE